MREAEPVCAESIGLKDIARSRWRELIYRGERIMYYVVFVYRVLYKLNLLVIRH